MALEKKWKYIAASHLRKSISRSSENIIFNSYRTLELVVGFVLSSTLHNCLSSDRRLQSLVIYP